MKIRVNTTNVFDIFCCMNGTKQNAVAETFTGKTNRALGTFDFIDSALRDFNTDLHREQSGSR